MSSYNTAVKKFNKNQILSVILFAFYYILQLCLIGYAITFFKEMGIGERVGGIGIAIACAVATVLQPIFGNVADNVRFFNWKKFLYIFSIIIAIISVKLIFWSGSVVDISLFCVAVVINMCMSPFINESCFYYNSKLRPVNFGPSRAGGSIAYAIISWILGNLMASKSPIVIPVAALIAAAGVMGILLLLPRVETPLKDSDDTDELENNKKMSFISLIKTYPVFFIFFLALMCIFTFQNLFSANLNSIVNDVGGDTRVFGIATAIAAVVEIPVMLVFSKILKKFSPHILILFSAICYLIRNILFLVAADIVVVYIAQAMQALTFAIVVPAMVYLSDSTMPKEYKNTGQNIMGMTISIGTILGFLIDGELALRGDGFVMSVGLFITGTGVLLSAIAYLIYKKTRKPAGNEMKLSVIIPTYNCEEYIRYGIESVLGQLRDDCELILVDDGSSDGTGLLLKDYELRDNVRVIYNEHIGASAARNTGIENSNGNYITFMDCDDMMQDGFIEKALKIISSKADLYIFGIERVPIKGENESWVVEDREYTNNMEFADEYIISRRLMVYSNCNKFYKKSIIDKANLRFEEELGFGEDRLFNYEYIRLCEGQIITSSLLQIKYLEREGSMSTRYMPDYFRNVLRLHKAKIECFTGLSKNTTDEQKQRFIDSDIKNEILKALERCDNNPREREENLEIIKKYVSDNE